MATVIVNKTKTTATTSSTEAVDNKDGFESSVSEINAPPLGAPAEEKRFFFQRTRAYDPNAIATQVSADIP